MSNALPTLRLPTLDDDSNTRERFWRVERDGLVALSQQDCRVQFPSEAERQRGALPGASLALSLGQPDFLVLTKH